MPEKNLSGVTESARPRCWVMCARWDNAPETMMHQVYVEHEQVREAFRELIDEGAKSISPLCVVRWSHRGGGEVVRMTFWAELVDLVPSAESGLATRIVDRKFDLKAEYGRQPGFETFAAIALRGYVWDGNVPSKMERDQLVKDGLIQRGHGYQWLTAEGVKRAIDLGLLDS